MKKNNHLLLKELSSELLAELEAILGYWASNSIDHNNGGFVGRIDENNLVDTDAAKGAVLNSRILWAFSEAFWLTGNPEYRRLADAAYQYILQNFIDTEYGGVYWTLDATGKPLDTKKQVYALAFAIYGCSTYYAAGGDASAKDTSINLYQAIERFSFDHKQTGYLDAFARDWAMMEDIRLSAKDANEKKTMNTHLHILEAYTALYKIWPDAVLKEKVVLLLKNFMQQIVDTNSHHLLLFFDEHWNVKSHTVSYGHDIEASWLLVEAAEAINDAHLIAACKMLAVKIAHAALEGLDKDGGLFYEYEPVKNHFIKEKHSWVQAEAMVGFFNAWQLSGDESFLQHALQLWHYIKAHIRDRQYGEWYWGRAADGTIMRGQDKVGMWKCPYHNSRACIDIVRRIGTL
jgi:mannobiose 2-epimerase